MDARDIINKTFGVVHYGLNIDKIRKYNNTALCPPWGKTAQCVPFCSHG